MTAELHPGDIIIDTYLSVWAPSFVIHAGRLCTSHLDGLADQIVTAIWEGNDVYTTTVILNSIRLIATMGEE